MRFFLPFLSIVLLLLTLPSTTNAQEEARYGFNFYVLGWDDSAELQYMQNGNLRSVGIIRNLINGTYRYNGNGPLQFFKQEKNAEGILEPVLMANLNLSGNLPGPLLLVFIKQQSPEGLPYQVFAVTNAVVPNRPNEVAVINFSNRNVAGKMNDATFAASPGAVQLVKVVPGVNDNIAFHMASQDEDGWRHAMSTVWGELPNIQNFIFIINNPRNPDRVQIKRIRLNRALKLQEGLNNSLGVVPGRSVQRDEI